MLMCVLRHKGFMMAMGFILLVAIIGILAPIIAPHDPYETDILNKFNKFSFEYPLGTDHLGRCITSRMIYGIRPTLGLAVITMIGTIVDSGTFSDIMKNPKDPYTKLLIEKKLEVMACYNSMAKGRA